MSTTKIHLGRRPIWVLIVIGACIALGVGATVMQAPLAGLQWQIIALSWVVFTIPDTEVEVSNPSELQADAWADGYYHGFLDPTCNLTPNPHRTKETEG